MNNTAENSDEDEEERVLKPVKKMSESSLPPPQSPQEPSKDNPIHKSVSMPSEWSHTCSVETVLCNRTTVYQWYSRHYYSFCLTEHVHDLF